MTYNGTTGDTLSSNVFRSIGGNATTATTLLNARNINGSFLCGSSDISLKNIISQGLSSAETLRILIDEYILYNVTSSFSRRKPPVSCGRYWVGIKGGSAQLAAQVGLVGGVSCGSEFKRYRQWWEMEG
jgi:hypothetical protein